jgi:hypothetical protein
VKNIKERSFVPFLVASQCQQKSSSVRTDFACATFTNEICFDWYIFLLNRVVSIHPVEIYGLSLSAFCNNKLLKDY